MPFKLLRTMQKKWTLTAIGLGPHQPACRQGSADGVLTFMIDRFIRSGGIVNLIALTPRISACVGVPNEPVNPLNVPVYGGFACGNFRRVAEFHQFSTTPTTVQNVLSVGRPVALAGRKVSGQVWRSVGQALRFVRSGDEYLRSGQLRRSVCRLALVSKAHGPHQSSRRTALSCHLCRSRWLRRDNAAKIRTPVAAISSNAANILGMFNL